MLGYDWDPSEDNSCCDGGRWCFCCRGMGPDDDGDDGDGDPGDEEGDGAGGEEGDEGSGGGDGDDGGDGGDPGSGGGPSESQPPPGGGWYDILDGILNGQKPTEDFPWPIDLAPDLPDGEIPGHFPVTWLPDIPPFVPIAPGPGDEPGHPDSKHAWGMANIVRFAVLALEREVHGQPPAYLDTWVFANRYVLRLLDGMLPDEPGRGEVLSAYYVLYWLFADRLADIVTEGWKDQLELGWYGVMRGIPGAKPGQGLDKVAHFVFFSIFEILHGNAMGEYLFGVADEVKDSMFDMEGYGDADIATNQAGIIFGGLLRHWLVVGDSPVPLFSGPDAFTDAPRPDPRDPPVGGDDDNFGSDALR